MAGQSTNRLAFPYFPKGCKIWLTGSRNTPARMSAWNAPDRYLERPVQTGALFCKGLSHRQIAEHSVVISKAQGLELLRKRGYIFTDEVNIPAVT